MTRQKSFLAFGGALGCLALLICVGVAAFSGFVYYTNVTALRPIDRIAIVDNDLNIQIVDPQGEHIVPITVDATDRSRIYMFPTWSPDSSHVAFVGLSGNEGEREGLLEVAPVTGGKLTSVFSSKSQFPFYAYWAPDSHRVGFLAQGEESMSLMVVPIDGSGDSKELDKGSSLFWSWSPDAKTLVAHTGGTAPDGKDSRLSILRQDTLDVQKLSGGSPAFQSPEYSPDGSRILYGGTGDNGTDELFLTDANGGNPRSVMGYDGAVAFAWSPDSKHIASMVTPVDSELPMYGPISVSDADGKNRVQVTGENALAFFWAPNSKVIAYLAFARADNGSGCLNCSNPPALSRPALQNGPVHLLWRVVDLTTRQPRTLATFVPTDNFIALLPFFDQYARSTTFWSPDSRHFVYTQAENDTEGSVWVIDLGEGAQPHKIGDGTLAVWSWK